MRPLSKSGLALLISAMLSTVAFASHLNTPYMKLDEGLYIGAYCHLSEGRLQGLASVALGLSSLTGVSAAVASLGLQHATMNKGDVMCIWLNVNHEKQDRLRRENRFSRRHFTDTGRNELVRLTSNFTMRVYGSDKKLIAERSGSCAGHAHCFSNVLKGTTPSAGFSACIEPTLSSGKKSSLVFGQGSAPATVPVVKETTCEARKSEY